VIRPIKVSVDVAAAAVVVVVVVVTTAWKTILW